ncbi:MAG TPA: polyprenyl synthetase family protein [Acidimicrobiales bacterium]|nr:polyprenyl synthetase family protein [Acidimicrobiales bacterium]
MVNVVTALKLPWLPEALDGVEGKLRDATSATDPYLAEIAGHLARAGGKRVRPAIAMCAASAGAGGGAVRDEVISGSVSVELVHLGSLYHDDVMDGADVRRGVESVNHRWGNLVAILAGDFLLARASGIAASLGTEVAGLLAATIGRLCEGQVSELKTAFSVDRTEEQYLTSINGKTASLLSTACRIGAITAGVDREAVDALTVFGDRFGMAFQVADDILDVVGTDAELGKPAGNDLAEGVYTLPVLRALGSVNIGDELRSLLGSPIDEAERDKARALVRSSDAVEQAKRVAWAYAAEAAEALALLPQSDERDALARLGFALVDTLPTT